MFEIPPWLHTSPQKIGDLTATGYQIGVQAGLEKQSIAARLAAIQAQREESAMRAQVQREQMDQEYMINQQKMQVESAYRDQMLSLARQEEQRKQQEVDLQIKKAADQLLASQKLQGLLGQNIPLPQAMTQVGAELFGNPRDLIQAYALAQDESRRAELPSAVNVPGVGQMLKIPGPEGYRWGEMPAAGDEKIYQELNFLQRRRQQLAQYLERNFDIPEDDAKDIQDQINWLDTQIEQKIGYLQKGQGQAPGIGGQSTRTAPGGVSVIGIRPGATQTTQTKTATARAPIMSGFNKALLTPALTEMLPASLQKYANPMDAYYRKWGMY